MATRNGESVEGITYFKYRGGHIKSSENVRKAKAWKAMDKMKKL